MTQKQRLDAVNAALREVEYDRDEWYVLAYPCPGNPLAVRVDVHVKYLDEKHEFMSISDGIAPDDYESRNKLIYGLQVLVDSMIAELDGIPWTLEFRG